jgi:AraC family transcriptional regulator of adaptative response / DNA-3-methyladenine glycosylase II
VLARAELSRLGLTTARAAAVNAFARAVGDGQIELDRSRRLDEFIASVTAIPGLGPWTAHYLALRLGEPDAFPAGDLGLRRALSDDPARAIATFSADELAERWQPYRAFAATHLWMSPEDSPAAHRGDHWAQTGDAA